MGNARKFADASAAFNSGGLIGIRNRLINGNAIIGQRGTINLTNTTPAYGTDRMLTGVVSGTGINVNLFKSAFGGSSSGLAHYISGSMTGGTPYWCQRIEAMNVFDLNGKNIIVSGLMYQDTGSTQSFVARIAKANAVDNFAGGVTALQTGTAFSVPTGVVTPFTAIFTLGASDASNGLMLEVYAASPITCTSKNICLTDLQLEKGAIQTGFDFRHVGTELTLAQRYFQKYNTSSGAEGWQIMLNYTGTDCYGAFLYPVTMRSTPSFSYSATSDFIMLVAGGTKVISAMSCNQLTSQAAGLYASVTASFTAGQACQLRGATSTGWFSLNSEL
jgi:hypothetical protein